MDYHHWFLVVGVSIILFFPLRTLSIWYWKIDRLLQLLESIDSRLSRMEPRKVTGASWKCTACGNLNSVGLLRCEICHEPRRTD